MTAAERVLSDIAAGTDSMEFHLTFKRLPWISSIDPLLFDPAIIHHQPI